MNSPVPPPPVRPLCLCMNPIPEFVRLWTAHQAEIARYQAIARAINLQPQ